MFLEKWAESLQPCQPHQSSRIWSINNEENSTGINIPIDKWLRFVCWSDLSTATFWQSVKAFEKLPLVLYITPMLKNSPPAPTPKRELTFFRSVTSESGVLMWEARGRKGCLFMEAEKQRASLSIELFKLEPCCVCGRWFRAQIPGRISMLSSRYQPSLKWQNAMGMLIVLF